MEQIKPTYQKQIFVCVNIRENGEECCGAKGSSQIHAMLKEYVKKNNLAGKVRVSKSYCQDLCKFGPVVSIYPENVVYKNVSITDVPEIIKRHCVF